MVGLPNRLSFMIPEDGCMTYQARTLFQKVWDAHVAHEAPGEPSLLYIDLHLVHEVTSPQAFDSLRLAGRGVRRPDLTLATIDHGVPTANRNLGIRDPLSKKQIDALIANCAEFGITLYGLDDPRQGIVHIIGPEQGITQPGTPPPTGLLGRWPSGSAPPMSNTSWPPKPFPRLNPRRWP